MSTGQDSNPFQSPGVPQPGAPQASGNWWIIPFQSGHQRATMTIALLMVAVVVNVLIAALSIAEYSSLVPAERGTFAPTGFGRTADEAFVMAVTPLWLLSVATVVAFCMWTHRAARNLPALGGRHLTYTPGWAVGWFFIPIAQLVMPYFVAAEIWRNSVPAHAAFGSQDRETTSPLVVTWWTNYVLSNVAPIGIVFVIIIRAMLPIAARHGSQQEMELVTQHYLPTILIARFGGYLLAAIAAVLAILYVRAVDTYQDAKFERISAPGFGG